MGSQDTRLPERGGSPFSERSCSFMLLSGPRPGPCSSVQLRVKSACGGRAPQQLRGRGSTRKGSPGLARSRQQLPAAPSRLVPWRSQEWGAHIGQRPEGRGAAVPLGPGRGGGRPEGPDSSLLLTAPAPDPQALGRDPPTPHLPPWTPGGLGLTSWMDAPSLPTARSLTLCSFQTLLFIYVFITLTQEYFLPWSFGESGQEGEREGERPMGERRVDGLPSACP